MTSNESNGCLCLFGTLIVCISCGTLFGPAYGWLIFGLILLAGGVWGYRE